MFVVLTYIIHVTGCLWYASYYGDIYEYSNWINSNGLKDDSMIVKYVSAIYWATVTITTVGYGDILPMNGYEFIWAMTIMVFGVAIFSYILSDLSSKFKELNNNKIVSDDNEKQLDKL